jgi:CRP-like cAMP-binding protein
MTMTSDRRAELLAACPLFTGIGADELQMVAETAAEVEFPAGAVIARAGEIGTGFFIVVDGRVRVIRDAQVIATLGAGEFFGELSVLDGQPRNAQVVAEEPTRCLALPTWEFERVLLEHPQLALAILRGLARRLRAVVDEHRA